MGAFVEVVHPGWLSLVVDGGRRGFAPLGRAHVGGPRQPGPGRPRRGSSGRAAGAPAIEVFGTEFAITFSQGTTAAVTGARVAAFLDGRPVPLGDVLRAARGASSG